MRGVRAGLRLQSAAAEPLVGRPRCLVTAEQAVTGQAWPPGLVTGPAPRLHPQVWMGRPPRAVACSVCLTEVGRCGDRGVAYLATVPDQVLAERAGYLWLSLVLCLRAFLGCRPLKSARPGYLGRRTKTERSGFRFHPRPPACQRPSPSAALC